MKIRLHSLSTAYDEDPADVLGPLIEKRLAGANGSISDFKIVRRSVDARQRRVRLIYSVDVEVHGILPEDITDASTPPAPSDFRVRPGKKNLDTRPVVVGAGPAGLFAAWLLAENGYRPLLLERGGDVRARLDNLETFSDSREPDPECNALFGLGGAGTFSDGKLRTGLNHPWLRGVLEVLVSCGAPERILIDAKPHVGTDKLRWIVKRLAKRIETSGGEIRYRARVDKPISRDGALRGVATSQGNVDCQAMVLAIGHSARDTWEALERSGVSLAPKPFQLGIRVEHDQGWLDRQRYGKAAGHPALGAAEYKLATRVDGIPVFSFCMCPGGETMPTVNEVGHLAVNGMSESDRGTRFASSGMVVTLTPEIYGGRDLASCLGFQRSVENACFKAGGSRYAAPAQRLLDFARGEPSDTLKETSYALGIRSVNLSELLPPFVSTPLQRALRRFPKRIPGYLTNDALALAPESRASSPVRILRDPDTLQCPAVQGLYPAGEGAGYAGGIMSAALDGLNAARHIIETYAPPR